MAIWDPFLEEDWPRENETKVAAETLSQQREVWAKKALLALIEMRKRFHVTHLYFRAAGELGKCYVCGNGNNELIREGEKLFKE